MRDDGTLSLFTRPSCRRGVVMLWDVAAGLLILWLLGLLLSARDSLVHVLLAAAVMVVAVQRVRQSRRA